MFVCRRFVSRLVQLRIALFSESHHRFRRCSIRYIRLPVSRSVRTLCVAIQTSCRLVLPQLLFSCFLARRRSVLPRRLFLSASNFFCLVIFSITSLFPFPLFPFSPDLLVSRARSDPPGQRRTTLPPRLGQILCLRTGSAPSVFRFPRRLSSLSTPLPLG